MRTFCGFFSMLQKSSKKKKNSKFFFQKNRPFFMIFTAEKNTRKNIKIARHVSLEHVYPSYRMHSCLSLGDSNNLELFFLAWNGLFRHFSIPNDVTLRKKTNFSFFFLNHILLDESFVPAAVRFSKFRTELSEKFTLRSNYRSLFLKILKIKISLCSLQKNANLIAAGTKSLSRSIF